MNNGILNQGQNDNTGVVEDAAITSSAICCIDEADGKASETSNSSPQKQTVSKHQRLFGISKTADFASSSFARSFDNEIEGVEMNRMEIYTLSDKTFTSSLNLAPDCSTNDSLDQVNISVVTNSYSESMDLLCIDTSKRRRVSFQDVMISK